MPRKSDLKTINNRKLDRRVKLTEKDKKEILKLKGTDTTTNIGKLFGVHRRTIDFIWHPEKLTKNKQLRKERGGSKIYYDRESHAASMREHRAYKKELHKKGLI